MQNFPFTLTKKKDCFIFSAGSACSAVEKTNILGVPSCTEIMVAFVSFGLVMHCS